MIKLLQFAPAVSLPNASPFCMKLETQLCMAVLPRPTLQACCQRMKVRYFA